MPKFLLLESTWINLDNVSSVEVVLDANNRKICKVWFTGDGVREFTGDDSKIILEFLKKNKA